MKHKQDAGKSGKKEEKRPIAARKIVAIVILGLILLATLLVCGYFGAKTFRLTRQRRAAMAAYERKDYATAERLLRACVRKDPNSEAEIVALANIYREFGNAGMEAQMWNSAAALNPLNAEYRENMLSSALRAADYLLLHGILVRKEKLDEKFTDQELYLYVIASYRAGYAKDADNAYRKYVGADPEAFRKNALGRLAEFMAKYADMPDGEIEAYLDEARQSDDPAIRYEALYTSMLRTVSRPEDDAADDEEIEALLKQIVDVNRYAGTPLLADFYFSRYRFDDAIAAAEPYLKTIDNLELYLLYAECCVFADKPDKLKELEKTLRRKPGSLPLMADYCGILIAYMAGDEKATAESIHKSGHLVSSPLSRFIHLQVALKQDSFNEILSVAGDLFSNPPFYDLHDRSLALCLEYLAAQMRKPENQDDPSRMADLAKTLAGYSPSNRLLADIILTDQSKKGLAKESDLMDALETFPDDLLLLEITAEHLFFYGKPEQSLELIEQAGDNGMTSARLEFIRMLALSQMKRNDEAAAIFRQLVEQSEFDLRLLAQYFVFCRERNRVSDMADMADRLAALKDGKIELFAPFFRAAALLSEDDEAKRKEALDMLAATANDNPDFTFYAANKLSEADRLDEAEAKYTAIENTYSKPELVYVNLSELYHEKNKPDKAVDAAKKAYELGKDSILPAFVYAKRLSEAGRFEEAVEILKFPRHEVNYHGDVVSLWSGCMRQVIEKSIADRKFLQAEEQCKHLLIIAPDDEFGKAKLEEIREIMFPKKEQQEEADPAAPV